MAKYRVYMQRSIVEYAEVEVEAESEEEAGDLAWDMACDVDFDADFASELEITDIDLVEGSADWFLDQYQFIFRPISRIYF